VVSLLFFPGLVSDLLSTAAGEEYFLCRAALFVEEMKVSMPVVLFVLEILLLFVVEMMVPTRMVVCPPHALAMRASHSVVLWGPAVETLLFVQEMMAPTRWRNKVG